MYGFHVTSVAAVAPGVAADRTVAPQGLAVVLVVPLGLAGWDHTLVPEGGLVGFQLGAVVVGSSGNLGGDATDPGFTAESVLEAARDRHASFDKQRHPAPILLRFLDRYQRHLVAEAIERDRSFLAAEHVVVFPLADFAAGYALPFAYHLLHGGDVELNGQRAGIEFNLIAYGRRVTPGPYYAGWVHGGRLYFRGDRYDWAVVTKIYLSYVPVLGRLSALSAGLQLPRSSEDAMVEQLAAFMADRGHKDPQIPPINMGEFVKRAAVAEAAWLRQIGDRRRSQVKYVKDVNPY